MNNEIKEILDKLKDGNWYNELDLIGEMWIELRWEETHLLLDYITNLQQSLKDMTDINLENEKELTNLQQENHELKSKLECYENGAYYSSKVDELEQENERLKEQLFISVNNTNKSMELTEDYKSRCEKASNKLSFIDEALENDTLNVPLCITKINSALNILQNGSDSQ